MDSLKWGILGTGYIANNFADCMTLVPEAIPAAVTGTSIEKAKGFAEKHGFAMCFDNFDKMLEESDIDIVYVAVQNNLHLEFVLKALGAGKHVLCEKPIADNLGQLNKMIGKAREKGLFLMEGMWTRCFPAVRKAKEWIDEGRIGQIRSVRADFGLKAVPGWQAWKAKAEFSGGAIRDVGIYALAMAFLGYNGESPKEIISTYMLKYGADYHSEILLKYDDSRTAFLTGSFNMVTDHHAIFYGDNGVITLGPKMWSPIYARLYLYDQGDEFSRIESDVFTDDYISGGMQYEISHVIDCISNGKKESNLFPLSESIEIMKVIDSLRKEWGVRYSSDV